jgi:hypothetical protein
LKVYGKGKDCTCSAKTTLSFGSAEERTKSSLVASYFPCSKEGYFPTLTRLLQLAPTNRNNAMSPPPVPLVSPTAQSILITHYVDSCALTGIQPALADTNLGSSAAEETTPRPWPTTNGKVRQAFFQKSRDALCLEIASGSARYHPAQWIRSSKMSSSNVADVLLPGSLRERGEFCIVHVGLAEGGATTSSNKSSSAPFAWKVMNVEFHRLNQFLDE